MLLGQAADHGRHFGAVLQLDQRAHRHAVAAPAGDFGGIQGVGAAERIEHHHRPHAAPFEYLLQAVAFFKCGLTQIEAVADAAAYPAFFRQNQRNRLIGGGVRERGAAGFLHQGAARIAKLLQIGLHLFNNQLAFFAFIAQQKIQTAFFFAQFV